MRNKKTQDSPDLILLLFTNPNHNINPYPNTTLNPMGQLTHKYRAMYYYCAS